MWLTNDTKCRYGGREIAKGELTFTQMLKVCQLAVATVHCKCTVHAHGDAHWFASMCVESGSLSCRTTLGMSNYQ